MDEHKNPRQDLRQRPEHRLDEFLEEEMYLSPEEIGQLIHELRVHQIELEIQNEELRLSREELETSRDRYADLYDFAPLGYLTLDEKGLIREANLTIATLLGIERGRLIGKALGYFVVPEDQAAYYLQRRRVAQQKEPVDFEVRLAKSDGTSFHARLSCLPVCEEADCSQCRIAVSDISESVRAEEDLRLAARVFQSTAEGIFITDPRRRIVLANEAFTRITGYSHEEVLGQNPRILSSAHHDAYFFHQVWQAVASQGQWQGEIWNRRKNGETYPQWTNISAVKDRHGVISHYVCIFSDISSMKQAESRLNYLATHDTLTDLPNRVLFQDRLDHALAQLQRKGRQMAVLFLDLDRFKFINDTLGHAWGDRVLQVVAKRLAACLRESDTVARMGGDEFTILLEEVSEVKDVGLIATKLLNVIAHPIELDGQEFTFTSSIGISLFPADGEDAPTLLKKADRAMYRAKEAGRNNYQFYTVEMDVEAHERLALASHLHRALERDELRLLYQPLIALPSERLVGVEALLRWQHPAKGLLPAETIISLAEESNLIVPISEWVLRTACEQNMAWQSKAQNASPISVAMNLSAVQYQAQGLTATVSQVLQETGLSPSLLNLEITEGTLIRHSERARQTLCDLKDMGVGLSIDDFGTGYSSLSYLYRFPINVVKIDRSFIRDVPQNTVAASIVTAIISMGHILGLTVVAEGVENEEQLHFLRSKGCDLVQGFYFSRPVDAEEIARLLAV